MENTRKLFGIFEFELLNWCVIATQPFRSLRSTKIQHLVLSMENLNKLVWHKLSLVCCTRDTESYESNSLVYSMNERRRHFYFVLVSFTSNVSPPNDCSVANVTLSIFFTLIEFGWYWTQFSGCSRSLYWMQPMLKGIQLECILNRPT